MLSEQANVCLRNISNAKSGDQDPYPAAQHLPGPVLLTDMNEVFQFVQALVLIVDGHRSCL